mgnify:FL=1
MPFHATPASQQSTGFGGQTLPDWISALQQLQDVHGDQRTLALRGTLPLPAQPPGTSKFIEQFFADPQLQNILDSMVQSKSAPLHGIMLGASMPQEGDEQLNKANVENMLFVQGDPLQEHFQEERAHLGTSGFMNELAAIQGVLVHHFFTGALTPLQVQTAAMSFMQTNHAPLQFMRDTLRAIGYAPKPILDSAGRVVEYKEPLKLPEAFEDDKKSYAVSLPLRG